MKSREQQRAEILKKLYWMKKDQEALNEFACLVVLKRAIIKAMGIEPIGKIAVDLSCFSRANRTYRTYTDGYSEQDEAKVATVIRRMAEQGYIRIHQKDGYQDVEILKTK